MITERAREVLEHLVRAEKAEDWDEAEIVCDGLVCYLGYDTKISRRTVSNLLRHVAISQTSNPGETQRYAINGTGRAILDDPTVADRIVENMMRGIACDHYGRPIPNPSA